jgi:SAM-dependent methyltransferase
VTKQPDNWCAEFFDDLFADQHLVRNDAADLETTISFLREKLHLRSGDRIFDQCCGIGSLGIALAKNGYDVTGVDLISSYIERARRDAENTGVSCRFEAGDAYQYVTPVLCDAAINWWTSFGYSPDDAQNIRMLQRVSESLKIGGWFSLDYMNMPQRLKEFEDKEISISAVVKNGCAMSWESRLDRAQAMVVRKWTYTGTDGKKVDRQGGGAKLYSRSDLEEMFTSCGFDSIGFYGSISGEPLSDSSPRCIVVARKGA